MITEKETIKIENLFDFLENVKNKIKKTVAITTVLIIRVISFYRQAFLFIHDQIH